MITVNVLLPHRMKTLTENGSSILNTIMLDLLVILYVFALAENYCNLLVTFSAVWKFCELV